MRALSAAVVWVVVAGSCAPAFAQVQQPVPPRDGSPSADQPSPERLRACKAHAAAKQGPDRTAFINFCLAYDGSAAASVFAWNKANLKK